MAGVNLSKARRNHATANRATLGPAQFGMVAIACALIAGSNALLQADEIRQSQLSQLTVKTPGLVAAPQPLRAANPAGNFPPSGPLSYTPAAAAGDAGLRSGPVVRLAQPIAIEPPGRNVVRQSNQEPIPPGGSEIERGTGVPPIGSLTINTLPAAGRLPDTVDRIQSMEAQLGTHEYHREWLNYSYFWEAPAFVNHPLYFQEVNLERYGYNWGVFQPFVSGAWFYVKIPLLPYMMTVHPPRECVYSLGYYRPGSCVPYQINWPEARLDAAIVEATFITGLCFLIP